jgi:ubiquitin-protein ligase E3 C
MNFHSFTGNSRKPRQVNLSGRRNTNPFAAASAGGAQSVVATAKEERIRRQREKETLEATKLLQRCWRGHRSREESYRSWRHEWDTVEERSSRSVNPLAPYTSEGEALSQLQLLLRFVKSQKAEDIDRLRRYLVRQSASLDAYPNLFSAEPWPFAFLRLQGLLLNIIEAILPKAIEDDSGANNIIFQGLGMTIRRIPNLTAGNSRQVYSVLRRLVQLAASRGSSSHEASKFILQAALPPLKALTSHIDQAYEAFACELLTLQELSKPPLDRTLLRPLADGINYKLLSNSLVSTLKSPNYHQYSRLRDRKVQAVLLGYVIYFHRYAQQFQSSFSYSSDKDYLLVVSELLSSVASNSVSDEDEEDPFITDQITSLINSDSISNFIPANTTIVSNSSSSSFVFDEEAKQIASFALTLLRHFPRKSEEIRIRLYMASTNANESPQSRIPAIRFFWQSAKVSRVVKATTKSLDAVIPLLKANETDGSLGRFSSPTTGFVYNRETCQDEWRVVLLFLELYSFALRVMDDEEFFSSSSITDSGSMLSWASQNSLPLEDVSQLVFFLKNLGYSLYFNSAKISAIEEYRPRDSGSIGTYFSISNSSENTTIQKAPEPLVAQLPGISIEYVKSLVTGVLRMLYERDSRRQFLPKGSWLMMSEFDMDTFIPSVVEEEEKRHRIQEEDDNEDSHDDDDDENSLIGTSHSARIRHAERLKRQQRKLARSRHLQAVAPRLAILQNMPFFIPFETRVQIFREFIRLDQVSQLPLQTYLHSNLFQLNRRGIADAETWRMAIMTNPDEFRRHHARIHRSKIFDDAFDQFFPLGEGLKEPIQITFVDAFDQEEAGIDGGGVTKEFLTSIIQEAFTPNDGLNMFVENDQHLLYPNPAAVEEHTYWLKSLGLKEQNQSWRERMSELLAHYEFLGRIIGKCLYEGILVDVSFAGFFLLKWALTGGSGHAPRESGYRANLNDLRELDEKLYQGLLQLKNYPEDVSDFALDFTVTDTITTNYDTHATKTITKELKPEGTNIPVTNDNRLAYISYVSRYRLQVRPYPQTIAFLRGLSTMIQPSWLNMFNQSELQTLVSGTRQSIDVNDLRRNTHYGGVYQIGDDGLEHPTVNMFWDVLEEMDDSNRRAVLKFVTSTPRAPLLGFGTLSPNFSIRDSGSDQTRLPSTSTCVNLLKLPIYSNKAVLKEKLLQAVLSGAGFDLS